MLSQFATAQFLWWIQCKELPTQEKQLNLVEAVVEAFKNISDTASAVPKLK